MVDLAPYPSPEEREAKVDNLAAKGGFEVRTYGRSVEGRPLRAVACPGPGPGAPRLLCAANIHGLEYIGALTSLAFLDGLASPGSPVAQLRERAEVWVVPCLNPDGYAMTWARRGDAPVGRLRTNAQGVDLNRNFPLPRPRRLALPGSGSDREGDATYRGPAPLSEPETAAIDALGQELGFLASANLHSFMGTLIPARVTSGGEFAQYRSLCRAFQGGQIHGRYRRLSSRWLDVFTGEMEDYQHHRHRTWAVCVEVFPVSASMRQHLRAPSPFWRFNPREPTPWVDDAVGGLCGYFRAALELERPEPDSP